MTTATERDILSAPEVLRQTLQRVAAERDVFQSWFTNPVLFLGSGSSYCVGTAAAYLVEVERRIPAQAVLAPDYLPRPGWTHIAISRTGQTSELLAAMRAAHGAGARVGLILGELDSPAQPLADTVLRLEFAVEHALVQTTFILAALLAIRSLAAGDAGGDLERVSAAVEEALRYDPAPLLRYERVVFLGSGWRQGVARSAALTMQESALVPAGAYQTLDYRHGPIACADPQTLVWCFDPTDDAASAGVIADVRATGAAVRYTGDDPIAGLAQAQLFAVRTAESRAVNPDAPRYLSRAIVLPEP